MSVQGKCISGHSKSRKVFRDLEKVFFKIIVYFDGLVIRKEIFSESSQRIERHIDVVEEVLKIQISVSFELCLDEEHIEFW